LDVTNSWDNIVSVISGLNNNVIGTIHVDNTPRGIAFDSAKGNLDVTNFNSNMDVTYAIKVPRAIANTNNRNNPIYSNIFLRIDITHILYP